MAPVVFSRIKAFIREFDWGKDIMFGARKRGPGGTEVPPTSTAAALVDLAW